jgi:hypothetical protein
MKKPRISYAYYTTPFSKPNINKWDKILIKWTKEICSIPKNTVINQQTFKILVTVLCYKKIEREITHSWNMHHKFSLLRFQKFDESCKNEE